MVSIASFSVISDTSMGTLQPTVVRKLYASSTVNAPAKWSSVSFDSASLVDTSLQYSRQLRRPFWKKLMQNSRSSGVNAYFGTDASPPRPPEEPEPPEPLEPPPDALCRR